VRDTLEISKAPDGKGKGKENYMTEKERQAAITRLESEMKKAAKMLEFEYAAVLRDQMIKLRAGE
jgi:excinuclease ABC subunit B